MRERARCLKDCWRRVRRERLGDRRGRGDEERLTRRDRGFDTCPDGRLTLIS